jgi:hypothetical protein
VRALARLPRLRRLSPSASSCAHRAPSLPCACLCAWLADKTVEWLPGALEQQCDEGLFEQIDVCTDLILGQRGQKSMWGEVRELMRLDEQRAAAAAAASDAAADADAAVDGGVPEITKLPATRYAPAAYTAEAAAATAAAAAPAAAAAAASGDAPLIHDVVEFRRWKGAEQWRVRWAGLGPEGDSWERRDVVWAAGAELKARAEQLM